MYRKPIRVFARLENLTLPVEGSNGILSAVKFRSSSCLEKRSKGKQWWKSSADAFWRRRVLLRSPNLLTLSDNPRYDIPPNCKCRVLCSFNFIVWAVLYVWPKFIERKSFFIIFVSLCPIEMLYSILHINKLCKMLISFSGGYDKRCLKVNEKIDLIQWCFHTIFYSLIAQVYLSCIFRKG